MWSDFYENGGWGMYPPTLFGLLLLAVAILYLLRPERRWLPLLGCLGVITFSSGLLGTAVGMVNSFRYISQVPKPDQLQIALLGWAESLNNLILCLIIVVLAGLISAVASLRAGFAKSAVARTS